MRFSNQVVLRPRDLLYSGTGGSAGALWTPSLMFFDGTLPVSLTYNSATQTYGSTYSKATFAAIYVNTRYVDPINGNNANDGLTAGTAWQTGQYSADTSPATTKVIVVGTPGTVVKLGAVTVPASKDIYFASDGVGIVVMGQHLSNADVSSWGSPGTNNNRTITLGASTLSGFVDTSQLDAVGVYKVCRSVASGAAIQTVQALGYGGVFRSTPSQAGVANGASGGDINLRFDTDIVAWSAAAPAPLVMSGTSRVMLEDVWIIGGAVVAPGGSTLFVQHNGGHLGAIAENFNFNGTSVLYGGKYRGCGNAGSDILDYSSGVTSAVFVEINLDVRDGSYSGADNCSTDHGGRGFRLNGTYNGSTRTIHDVFNSCTGTFACTLSSSPLGTTEFHIGAGFGSNGVVADCTTSSIAQLTFSGSVSNVNARVIQGDTCQSRIIYYDNCLSGKTTSGPMVDRSGVRPTADKIFWDANAVDTTKLFQNQNGTGAVTADGDPVGRIVVSDGGAYILCTGTTYKTNGTLSWFLTSGATWAYRSTDPLEDNVCYILTVNATDTQAVLMGQLTTSFFDARSGGSGAITRTIYAGAPTYRVNKVAVSPSTPGALNTALLTGGVAKTATINAMNADWTGWLMSFVASYGGGLGIDGNIYDFRCIRNTGTAYRNAQETASGALGGNTI